MSEADDVLVAEIWWVARADAARDAHLFGASRRWRWRNAEATAELNPWRAVGQCRRAETGLARRRDIALNADKSEPLR
jgi:hypothetical protein